jgi:SAM-dependent methyltransferase
VENIFDPIYAEFYDLIYQDKDYLSECDLIERLFSVYGDAPIRSVLDLGCGTGNHAIPLAKRGYEVIGIDQSQGMLDQLARKMRGRPGMERLSAHYGDIRCYDLGKSFDAALMMFAVLGYQLGNEDVLSALRMARAHLRPHGLLLLDAWYGPAVLMQQPSERKKIIPTPEGRIIRISSGELDIRQHVCTVHFRAWRDEGDHIVQTTEEKHHMRYFFPKELELFLHCAGFSLERLGRFPEFDLSPDENSWNVLGVARAV